MTLALRSTFLAVLFALLAGCASLGIPQAETFAQKLSAGYSSVTAVNKAVVTLLQQKKISPDDAENIIKQSDNALAGLDITRTIGKTDLKAADARLTAIRTVLTALSAYLASRQ